MIRLLAFLLPMAPFAFGLMRAVETEGRDLRYLWVALAAFAGAMARMALARGRSARPGSRGALAAGVFVFAATSAAVVAWMLGTVIGPAMLMVAAGFGACFAAATYLGMARSPIR